MSPHGEPLRLKPGGPFLVSLPIAATLLSAALGAPSRLPPAHRAYHPRIMRQGWAQTA
jgi:hypothetical protein